MPRFLSHRLALIVILLLLSAIVIAFLRQDLWVDEQRTLFYAGAVPQYGPTTPTESLARIAENLWQAPGYYLFIWGWGRLAGWSNFALRLPSLFFGLIAIALTYDLARTTLSKRVALYAVFLLAFSAFFVNFLHDMRAYSMFAFFTVMMLWAYMRVLRVARPVTALLLLFIASTTGLLYTHFFSAFPIAALGLCHLWFNRKHPRFWLVILAFLVSGGLFIPWLQVLIDGARLSQDVPRHILNLSAIEIAHSIFYFFSNGGTAFSLLLLLFALQPEQKRNRLLLFWLLFSALLLWGVTRLIPALTDVKYMIFFWPILAVVFASGLASIEARGLKARWILLIWGVLFAYSVTSTTEQTRIHPWYRPPFTELASTLHPLTYENDALIFIDPTGEGYVDNELLDYYVADQPFEHTEVVADGLATTDQVFTEQAQTASKGVDRVWVAYDMQADNWRTPLITQTTLPAEGFSLCGTLPETKQVHIDVFGKKPAKAPVFAFAANDEPQIDTFLISQPQLTPDRQLLVVIGWRVPDEWQSQPYSLAIHIDDHEGHLIAQADTSITQGTCHLAMLDLSGIPADTYDMKFTVYNWQTGDRLPSLTPVEDDRPVVVAVVVP